MKQSWLLGCCLIIAAGCASKLPTPRPIREVVYLDQNWSADGRDWFHHASQGTATLPVPYSWFLALEQPALSLGEVPLLADESNLVRYGFLTSPKSHYNPDGLPVGFARDPEQVDPVNGHSFDAIGFTCAACHTGQIEYRGTAIRIEGGPATTDLGKFRNDLKWALAYTKLVPGRFSRFARRVLGDHHTAAAERDLKQQFDVVLADAKAKADMETKAEAGIEEGFMRLDALGSIANLVFGVELDARNVAPLIAPVAYPHIWDTPWFDWVQYNGSIRQPMVRNAGEAMGVNARVNLRGEPKDRYRSTVRVQELFDIEQLVAGPEPFAGLRAPRWPEDVLGPIDRDRAQRGAALYAAHCQKCHLPPVGSPELMSSSYWTSPNAASERYLRLQMVKISYVGTDPNQAKTMTDRKIDTGVLGFGQLSYGEALGKVVEETAKRWYDEHEIPLPRRDQMNGNRPNDARASLEYKARPLDGIWATPPYLHNGSVPDLYSMFLPGEERPSPVYLWTREYDPKRVGYVNAEDANGTRLDVADQTKTKPGNSNRGHEFRDGPLGNGVIGPLLKDEERWDLVEYLKTL